MIIQSIARWVAPEYVRVRLHYRDGIEERAEEIYRDQFAPDEPSEYHKRLWWPGCVQMAANEAGLKGPYCYTLNPSWRDRLRILLSRWLTARTSPSPQPR